MDERFTPPDAPGKPSGSSAPADARSGVTADVAPETSRDEQLLQRLRRQLRQQALAAREALSPAQCAHHAEAIRRHVRATFPYLAARRVAFCWPIRNEPDLRPLMTGWLAAGAPGFMALLPVADAPARPLSFRAWTPDCAMGADRYGIPVPLLGESATPQALFIPVNAFDAQGYRIGYGGGFFDRTLAALAQSSSRPLAIGVGYSLARVATTYPQAHDFRLDAIVTELGVHWPTA